MREPASSEGWLLRAEGVHKRFALHEAGRTIFATYAASFVLHPGEVLAVTGPSGAGKSSLLKCIWRAYLPSAGALWWRAADGGLVDLARAGERQVLSLRGAEIGYASQFLRCLPRKSALEVVCEPLVAAGTAPPRARERARELLAALGIAPALWPLPPATFSGGEQQRVNLARALARPARLLLLDEPTASLDSSARERVLALLAERKAAGTAMLAVTHDRDLLAALADGELRLEPGRPAEAVPRTSPAFVR